MKIIGNTVILRDLCRGDIERRILWETQQTEWQQWDAPWEYEETGGQASLAWLEAYREHLESRVQELRWMDEQQLRRGFEIALASDSGKSIGWGNSYFLKDDFTSGPVFGVFVLCRLFRVVYTDMVWKYPDDPCGGKPGVSGI